MSRMCNALLVAFTERVRVMKKAMTYANTGPWRATAGEKRVLKYIVKRARRQAERIAGQHCDHENVPIRFTKGWL